MKDTRFQLICNQFWLVRRTIIRAQEPLRAIRSTYQDVAPSFHDQASTRSFLMRLDQKSLKNLQDEIIFFTNCIPFLGFGFLDNFVMIIAGEYIDLKLGVILGISTMAAAALGNLVSDIGGLGLAGYVEMLASKCGLETPRLSVYQSSTWGARMSTLAGRTFGISLGCLIGMFPLLFYGNEENKATDDQSE
ncbi:DgyrCDS4288 [Dimorphilus gyrociliatus]|uniref:DgyrCDS4288 n=1 Tax=Dimorphilus gyrociliatus TaxID=2664684 RepID=A0A7I8VIR7_9ANNE|nr:DgyrCDS4288 [Dimorphilus gyrociliatus]